MRVLLISANTETMNMPVLPLGLACVAAATRNAGNEVALLNLMFEGDPMLGIRNSLEDFRPNVIGISVRNIDDQNLPRPQFLLAPVREIIASCRSLSVAPIILGGAGYSIFPDSALRYLGADMGIQGEGEVVFPVVVDRIGKGAQASDIPGICLPGQPAEGRSFEKNLDDLPLPEPSLWIPPGADNRKLWVPVQSRRGCPLDCTFCSSSAIEGRSVRRRSPDRIVKWLAELRETGCRNFNFVDNTFNLPPTYAKDLCRQVIQAELDLNLWCIIYPKWIDTKLVELMRRAGCRQISFGFESGSDRMLRRLHKRFNRKEVSAVSEMFAEAGIERMGFLLLGGPGETKDSVEESLSFADSLNLEALKITVGLRIYRQTPLARTALSEGVIRADEDLLLPRFYLTPELRDWLPERVATYKTSRPWVN
ncbi:MAG: radical SAM protein [Terriglobia bacterium]